MNEADRHPARDQIGPLRTLADYQLHVENELEYQLNREPTVEEIALAMRYLPVKEKREILAERSRQHTLSAMQEQNLRMAMTKVLLVRQYKELAKEFTMTLTVRAAISEAVRSR